jgi:phosphoribosylformimino-5-aminoimidazole carboxamide ribotide isomerase
MAEQFEQAGATRLHVVDLDGARDGKPSNVAAIADVLRRTKLVVQIGGGIRDRAAASLWLDAGARRIVLGTAAIKNPELVREVAAAREGSVVVAIDARGGEVAIEGWLEGTGRRAEDVAREVAEYGVAAVLFTNIDRDGTREGPDVSATAALQREIPSVPVIASGGIGTLDHLRALNAAGVRMAVCGKALYSGAFTLAQAFDASEGR